MENPSEIEETDNKSLVQKDRSLLYMGIGLGVVILIMGYLTLFVDDPWKIFRKDDVPEKVVDNGEKALLDESASMSDEQVRTSLTKFIEAFYYDLQRGYFDPPSYFANITETFYNYHNLTHSKLKEIYWKRMSDVYNLKRVWIVSTLKFERSGDRILANYWAKESYFRPSVSEQYSATIQYEMIIDADGKIVSLKEAGVRDEVINKIVPDSTAAVTPDPSLTVTAPEEQNPENKIFDYSVVDVQPEFNGGQKELVKYISSNLRYPANARQNNIQGKVYVAFIIEKDGDITDVKVRQGIGGGCDEEAVRVLKNSPKWKPGVLKGSPVRTYYVQPITFQLAQ